MIGWVARVVMSAAAVIAGWFVARDAANFGVVQAAVAVLLLTAIVAAVAFRPHLTGWLRTRRGDSQNAARRRRELEHGPEGGDNARSPSRGSDA